MLILTYSFQNEFSLRKEYVFMRIKKVSAVGVKIYDMTKVK